jgi:acetoacetate decarboxylase
VIKVAHETQPPPPPWSLNGNAVFCVRMITGEVIEPRLPSWAQPMQVGHGVPCVLYLARYGVGSTLHYHELIVANLIRVRWRPMAWITHIYVDDARSMHGGRGIWGLPKMLATFEWSSDEIRVSVDDDLLCVVQSTACRRSIRMPLRASFASLLHGASALTRVRGSARISRSAATVFTGTNSPLELFGFDQCRQAFHLTDLSGAIAAPRLLA